LSNKGLPIKAELMERRRRGYHDAKKHHKLAIWPNYGVFDKLRKQLIQRLVVCAEFGSPHWTHLELFRLNPVTLETQQLLPQMP
jgi:hypothetical protein